jgi:hypothetical protein
MLAADLQLMLLRVHADQLVGAMIGEFIVGALLDASP